MQHSRLRSLFCCWTPECFYQKYVTNWALPDTGKRQLTLIHPFSILLLWSASEACGHSYLLIKKINYIAQHSTYRLKELLQRKNLHVALSVYRDLPLCILKMNRILYICLVTFGSSQLWTSFWLTCSFQMVSSSTRGRFILGWSTFQQDQVCQNLVL